MTVDVWAGISMLGKTELFIYEGCLDAQNYQDILRHRLVSAAQEWFEDAKCGWEMQHLSHSKVNVALLGRALRWCMENLWAILDERLENKKFKTQVGMEGCTCDLEKRR